MWGEDNCNQLRLLQEDVDKFQVDIPEERLGSSSTFREAIAATRALGYRYLWIDSLCIIQDSASDWDFEARRMAIVYGNAVCNLAFLYPPTPTPTTLISRDPRTWSPCILRRPPPQHPHQPAITFSLITSSWKFEYLPSRTATHHPWLVQHHWPLFRRAWTFQEYLLSPRTLLLGAQNIMYHCSLHFYDELVGPLPSKHIVSDTRPRKQFAKDRGKSRYFPDNLERVGQAEGPSVPAMLGFMIDWHGVLNEYRGRRLKFAKDRVMAFAGIARACSNMGKLTYLAGLWVEMLPLCLLWCVQKKMDIILRTEYGLPRGTLKEEIWTDEKLEEVEQLAPSWSWFALPVYKYYEVGFLFGDDEVFLRAKSYAEPPLACWDDIYWAEGEGVGWEDGASVKEGRSNAFFDFSESYIQLTAYVLSVKINWPADIHKQMAGIRDTSPCQDDHELLCDPVFDYFPDKPRGRDSPPRNAIYAIVGEVQVVQPGGTKTIQRRLAGLMLVPSEHTGAWRRIGVWKLRINIIDVPVTKESITVVAERWREYTVLSSKWKMASLILV
ncbi:hypothetical protein J1614_003225 [Plenodomus biglobosus]|nr:hypothetical protein J1614_003225 [Plenodomus biglobosus]